jgi:nucleoside-diphosphate-sugar epimerase
MGGSFPISSIKRSQDSIWVTRAKPVSFCYVEDTIRGLQVMMEKEEANGEIINIGNPVEHSVLQVARW